jgi:hypothetical protein
MPVKLPCVGQIICVGHDATVQLLPSSDCGPYFTDLPMCLFEQCGVGDPKVGEPFEIIVRPVEDVEMLEALQESLSRRRRELSVDSDEPDGDPWELLDELFPKSRESTTVSNDPKIVHRIADRYFRQSTVFPDGRVAHESLCQFWNIGLCTCGLIHALKFLPNPVDVYPEYEQECARHEQQLDQISLT